MKTRGKEAAVPARPDLAVDIQDLEKRFGDFVAVNRVSLQVPNGEIFGFLGPNGAGKSTTIRMLCGLLLPSGGSGRVAGFDIRRETEQIKRRIGYMSQKFSLYEDLTVEDNIRFFSGIYSIPRERREERKRWVLKTAGLEGHEKRQTGTLSGGWKQRLALGCAVLHEPPILFLDEPTSGVDPNSRRQFWNLIYEMAEKGVTVFVTTHYMDEAEYCDRVALIYRGEMIALGSPAALKRETMEEAVINVSCDRAPEALDCVERVPGVREAALFGRGLHAVAADAEAVLPKIAAALAEKGLRAERIERIVPSMEDVFVSLIENRDRAAAPRQEVRT